MSIVVIALSYVERIDPRTQMVRRIEAAMEETADQASTIVEPSGSADASLITRAHRELLTYEGFGPRCTVLLEGRKGLLGALIFERDVGSLFDSEFIANVSSLTGLTGRLLEINQRDERSIFSRCKEALEGFATQVTGPSNFRLKMSSACAVLVLLVSVVFSGEHNGHRSRVN